MEPLYDSAGLLHGLLRQPSAADPQTRYLVFYLAGRPVAQAALETGEPERWWYLTTDHLGTPLVATDGAGEELWENRFEPFGRDMDEGTAASALANEMFLRFPGQWEDDVWQEATMGAEVFYNVYRWYSPDIASYSRPDPLPMEILRETQYVYVSGNPLLATDPLGLVAFEPCSELPPPRPCECDEEKVAEAAQISRRFEEEFCEFRNSSERPPSIPKSGEGAETIGKVDPRRGPMYRPQGDLCVDFCICEHERQHQRDVHSPRVTNMLLDGVATQQILNWLECRGYRTGTRCLQGARQGGTP